MDITRGIILVANKKSQMLCANLIYSIRKSGCRLPIRIIHFGGDRIDSDYVLNQVEYLNPQDFSTEAIEFLNELKAVLKDCSVGYLYRFLAWFTDWDEFIYSDNDIVALMNWERLFEYLNGYEIVHADEEYTTGGKFNFNRPSEIINIFGENALEEAITAGHFVVKRNNRQIEHLKQALNWFNQHTQILKLHDQALLHIAVLIGKWRTLNLCKPPDNWLSSWSGDHENPLALIQKIQRGGQISHLHYSGGTPNLTEPIDELLLSSLGNRNRKMVLFKALLNQMTGLNMLKKANSKARRKLVHLFHKVT